MKENNIILEKSFNFALEIVELYKILKSNNEYILSKQLFRSGTSIAQMLKKQLQHNQEKILFINYQFRRKKQENRDIG
jgi:four helix bundle protein